MEVSQAQLGCPKMDASQAQMGCPRMDVGQAQFGCPRMDAGQVPFGCPRMEVSQAQLGCFSRADASRVQLSSGVQLSMAHILYCTSSAVHDTDECSESAQECRTAKHKSDQQQQQMLWSGSVANR